MSQAYREATLFVCDQVEDLVSDGDLRLPRVSFRSALLLQTFGVQFARDESGRRLYTGIDSAAHKIAEAAWTSPDVFDLCCDLCRSLWDAELQMPRPFRDFVSKILGGAERPRSGRGRAEPRNWFERHLIYSLALFVSERFGLTLTRNDASTPISAADAVAEGFSVCGRPTEFTDVKNLCVHPDYARFREDYETYEKAARSREGLEMIVEVLLARHEAPEVTGEGGCSA